MSGYKPTPEQLQALLQYASGRLGVTPEELKKTLESGGAKRIASKLPPEDAEKFTKAAGDIEKMEEILKSPKARQILDKFLNSG